MSFFQNVAFGWWLRRILEVGGWVGGIVSGIITFYSNMPPALQEFVTRVLTNNWQEMTLAASLPLLGTLATYVWSYFTTTRPQVVTAEGKKVIASSKTAQNDLKTVAREETARKEGKTLVERIGEIFKRKS